MKSLKLISFLTFITYNSAVPAPDTNIQIQHYDGPVYLGSTPPNCCPFCNSILKPQTEENSKTYEPAPEVVYPQPVYNNYNTYEEPYEITISVDSKDENPTQIGKDKNSIEFGKNNLAKATENCRSMLHTDALKAIHNIPLNYKTPLGNTYPGTGIGTDIFGTVPPCATCTPLSNYLPINTASQNTCQVPMLTYGSGTGNSDEPVLVPQKFMYSLILDGEVGSNQKACDSRFYYY